MMDEKCNSDLKDDTTTYLSTVNMTTRFQKSLIYNKWLPYADELHAESEKLLIEIKGYLGQAVMLRELQPGCVLWSANLIRYIKLYGYRFSKEDHILFIKVMYELITIPNLEPHLIHRFGITLNTLLKKKILISPEELELPWKPLYELTYRIRTSTASALGMYRYFTCLANTLDTLVHAAKVYFPLSATQEILDELRHTLCPLDGVTMTRSIEALEWFLPVQLAPEHHSLGHELWFDEFMNIWEICHNAPLWESKMMWLMARLASCNIGYINWEPHLPLMFTRFIRTLNLPVLYKQTHGSKPHKMDLTAAAIWITAVLGNGSSAQIYLDKFLKTIETYFHPANFGRWLGKLLELLGKLPYYFIIRLHKERYGKPTWETPVPESHKLTEDDVDAFVKSMMPIAMTAMFSIIRGGETCGVLQHLATMRPNLVIPLVLEKMYSTLDSLTEPHKLTAAMICMVAVARPMVQGSRNKNTGYAYPEGPMHVLPFLFSSLPGIDPNDPEKFFITCRLISDYATLIPIVDCSRSSVQMDEEERMICETTSRFEDFILQFLDKIFIFIDSSSLEFIRHENYVSDGKSKMESLIETSLSGVCTSVLVQTSDAIFESALHKLRMFVTERILETKVAGQLAAAVCRIFARVNGHSTLRALVPVLSETILSIIDEGDDIVKEENLDNRLLYAMLLLSAIIDAPGCYLLPYINTLVNILDRVLHLKSREGSGIACCLLKNLFFSLSSVLTCRYRSLERDYNDPEYPYIRDWGHTFDIESLHIDWYIPGENEFAVIQQLLTTYLIPEVEKLQKYCKDWSILTREELLSSLNIINSIISGCEYVLPAWDEPPVHLVNSSLNWLPFKLTMGIKGNVTMPDGSNIKQYIVKVISDLQKVILKHSEDDTKSLFVLIQIWQDLIVRSMRVRENYEKRCKNFQTAKRILVDKLIGTKGQMGLYILERAEIQHEARLQSEACFLTNTHVDIISELFTLATSRYADVRLNAQYCLSYVLSCFPYSYLSITPQIIDILKKDTEIHHEAYKGVLYILFRPKQEPFIVKRDWKLLRSLWPALVLSKPSEKPSVIRLKENLVETIHKHFPTTAISIEVPERCLTIASELWKTKPYPTVPQPNVKDIEAGIEILKKLGETNLENYNGLLNDLLHAILEKNLHWRHRLMAMNFIHDLVHPEQIYPPNIVRYFLGALIHDSLDERKIAIKTVIFMLKQQKRKHPKVEVDVSRVVNTTICKDQLQNFGPGAKLNNSWLQYNYETRPLTPEQWDEPRFVHESYIGYYTWPKKLEVYAPSSQQPTLDPEIRKLTEHEREVDMFFNNPQNIEKLISFLSLEEKKGKDKFNGFKCLLFKSLFRNHGIVPLKHFIPHLQRLVQDKQESSQRCAAEITAGVIRGAKHWPFQMTCDMWKDLLPIIRTALSNLTVETVVDWGLCFATAQQCRDPNRHHWFLECLMEEPRLGESETSFAECGRLYILEGTLNQQSWRVTELLQRVLTRLEDRLFTSPFQSVRNRLASLLVTIFDGDRQFLMDSSEKSSLRAQQLIDKVTPRLKKLAEETTVTKEVTKEEQCLSLHMRNINFDDSTTNSELSIEDREATIRLLKTICKWIVASVSRSQYGALPGFYELFPIVCQLENCEIDEELVKTCTVTLAALAQAFTLPNDMSLALNAVTKMSRNSSWWARATCLEFLQILIFHNMSIVLSNQEWVTGVRDIVLYLLEDVRLEVRDKASQVLGGLLHCMFIPDQEDLLEKFKVKARTKLHKRNCVASNGDEIGRNPNIDAIRIRHAGVLGLCAFIRAHPYDIPKYLPPVFEHLGIHLSDPQPIPATIRKTLGDFKRTHYDGWTGMNGHAQNFTEEQLAILQNLTVPPSHYA